MTMQTQTPISARFASLETAERASLQLRETGFEARVGVTGADHVVTLAVPDAAPDERREAARAALEAAGGQVIAVAGSHAPRRVQPGFTDAAPGIVPDESPLATEPAEAYEDAGGRFARQIERAPEEKPGTSWKP